MYVHDPWHDRTHEHRDWPLDLADASVVVHLCRPRWIHFGFWTVTVLINLTSHPVGRLRESELSALLAARTVSQVNEWMWLHGHTCSGTELRNGHDD